MDNLNDRDESVFRHETDYKPSRTFMTWLVGEPLITAEQAHQTIGKAVGLAVFASDALSSSAYSTQELMLILAAAGPAAFSHVVPITIAVVVLLAIITISYEQTIHAYPDGGGAYIVARDNLGNVPAETAAAALLMDYILTVAVSVSSGIAQITSAFPALYQYRVVLAVICVLIVMVINLRGVKESGSIFAVPTYFFLISMLILIITGLAQYFTGNLGKVVNPPPMGVSVTLAGVSTFLVLKAFASGTTALTGVEAISNGVTAFKEPRADNAGKTLIMMSGVLGTILLGIAFLTVKTGAVPSELESNFSQIARTIFHSKNIFYYMAVASTMIILIVAANTAFADYPRLSAMVASDGYLPRKLAWRGSRLVYSRGIIILAAMASALIIFFQASVSRLIPLYAVGVFISFTLSQFGMALRWNKIGHLKPGEVIQEKGSTLSYDPLWHLKMFLNGFGALCTLVITFIFGITKFIDGAWFVLALTPILVFFFTKIHTHYNSVAEKLSMHGGEKNGAQIERHRVLLLVGGVHQGSMKALRYARDISDDVTAIHVAVDVPESEKVQKRWAEWGDGYRLVILDSPYRLLLQPLLSYIDDLDKKMDSNEMITVVVPQFVSKHPFQSLLHSNTADQLREALLFYPNVVITEVPYDVDDLKAVGKNEMIFKKSKEKTAE